MPDLPNVIYPGLSLLGGGGIVWLLVKRSLKRIDNTEKTANDALNLAQTHRHPQFVRADICNTVRDGCGKERAAVLSGIDDKLNTIASIQKELRQDVKNMDVRLGKIEADVEHIKKNGGAK